MKNKVLLLAVLVVFLLTACAGEEVIELPEGMSAAMIERANAYDANYPQSADINVTRICVEKPAGLYWNEKYQTWAVVCVMPMPNMYGAVMLDANYKILNSEHINAVSLAGLEDMIASVGWERAK